MIAIGWRELIAELEHELLVISGLGASSASAGRANEK